ncbi:MAG: hypothetical protein LBF37_01600 [Rickettsiales bacterium]|jgi:hypothetical protein|nr:hypothetical protein [Rickettsiales bacterium]
MEFEVFSECVSAANYRFINSYNSKSDGTAFNYTDNITTTKMPASCNLNLKSSIRNIDISGLRYTLNKNSSLKPLVDMIHILQASGFNIIGLEDFNTLDQEVKNTPNPYLSLKGNNTFAKQDITLEMAQKMYGKGTRS